MSNDGLNPADQLSGSVIENRYLVREKLASGGAGTVYLATDSKMMGRCVVVKFLLQDWLQHDDIRRKFEHEKEALARLDHPGIVGIFDSGVMADGTPFFVMPFVSGRTLRSLLDEDPKPAWNCCRDIIDQVTDALAAAHRRAVLHRDVKPANIMVDVRRNKSLRVRLIDFGIARVFDSKVSPITAVGRPLGTLLYVAPEQLEANDHQTPAADIYSCGVIAYEMLTGQLPFEPKSMYHMMHLQQAGLKRMPSEIVPELGPGIDLILKKALAYAPEERYQDASEFGRELATELRIIETRPPVSVENIAPVTHPRIEASLLMDSPTALGVARSTKKYNVAAGVEDPAPQPGMATGVAVAETTNPEEVMPARRHMRRFVPAALIAGLAFLLLCVTAAGIYVFKRSSLAADEPSKTVPAPQISKPLPPPRPNKLEFYLTIVGSKDKPHRYDGLEILPRKSAFILGVTAQDSGNFYLFNEGLNESRLPEVNLVIPTDVRNDGLPDVESGKTMETPSNDFGDIPGKEVLWIVWTKGVVPEFEKARLEAIGNLGVVTDPATVEQLKSRLDAYAASSQQRITESPDHVTTVESPGDVIVYRMEVEHR